VLLPLMPHPLGDDTVLHDSLAPRAEGPQMYCPTCGAEYRPGFYQCNDCNVQLVPDLPSEAPLHLDEPADSVIVFESAVPGETEMIAAALEDAGIVGVIRRSIAGGLQLGFLDGGLTPGQAYSLTVPSFVEERARTLISSLRPEDMSAPVPPEPHDLRHLTGPSTSARFAARAMLLLLLVPVGMAALAFAAFILVAVFK